MAVPDSTYTQGLLGVYELGRTELLRDVFLWPYERSADRYAAMRQSVGEPDAFRLRHRTALRQIVASVIREAMDQKAAAKEIADWAAEHVAEEERARFIEAAETELLGMHEGNFARYQIYVPANSLLGRRCGSGGLRVRQANDEDARHVTKGTGNVYADLGVKDAEGIS